MSSAESRRLSLPWRWLLPLGVLVGVGLLPVPEGLPAHAWLYFAVFTSVVAALILEPLPGPALGLIAVTTVAICAPWMLFSPEELAQPAFKLPREALVWAIGGFGNPTVWLVFSAFMFALAYERTGLGRRIALGLVRVLGGSTLSLGYAMVLAETALAPFTPSNTARSAEHAR